MSEAVLAAAKADHRLIVPLDVPTADEARVMVAALGDAISFYKVGLELFATDGMTLARELKAGGKQVFLDWKLTTFRRRCSGPPPPLRSPAATLSPCTVSRR